MATELGVSSAKGARLRALDRDIAMTLAATEYDRVAVLFESLTAEQWAQPTECPGWDVRAMAGHMLGMTQMIATVPALVRQQTAAQRGARKTGALMIDVLTAAQVAENAALSPRELVAATSSCRGWPPPCRARSRPVPY